MQTHPRRASRPTACGLVVALLALGCTSRMDVEVTRFPAADAIAATGPHCAPEHLEVEQARARGCLEIGEVSVTDTGYSWDCEKSRVLRDIDSAVCSLGGDAVAITPLAYSGCYQARGLVLACSSSAAD